MDDRSGPHYLVMVSVASDSGRMQQSPDLRRLVVAAMAWQPRRRGGTASSYSLKSGGGGSGLVFMLFDGNVNIATPSAIGVWDGKWHHAVGTYDGATIRLYIDGVLASSRSWSGRIKYGLTDGDQFIIGNPFVVRQLKQYRGDVDEVLVWD